MQFSLYRNKIIKPAIFFQLIFFVILFVEVSNNIKVYLFHLAVQRRTLDPDLEDTLTYPMLITAFYLYFTWRFPGVL